MAVLSDISGVSYWTALAQQLFLESQSTGDDDERAAEIDAELYRILADRLDKARDGHHRIDTAANLARDSLALAWEWWRAATARDSGSQRAALERLAAIVDRPRTLSGCHLALARLKAHHLDDSEGAAQSLAAAHDAEPDSRGVLWARTLAALAAGDDAETASLLEELVLVIEDPIWRATLELELASLSERSGDDASRALSHLSTALEQPGIDWTIAHEVLRSCDRLDDSGLAEQALQLIAKSALEQPQPGREDRPSGYSFDAFKRGPQIAAAHYLMLARLREAGQGDPTAALEALDLAQTLVPDSGFITRERARLLEAAGRGGDALSALPDGAPTTWRAELALAAGQPDLAAALAREAAAESPSLLPLTIAEVAAIGRGESPDEDPGPQDPAEWLAANPDHPDAAGVARDLLAGGHDLLLARLLIEERDRDDRPWPADVPDGAEWAIALDAVTGPDKARAPAYLHWADSVSTPELKALLVAAAARAAEAAGDREQALDLCRQALELDPGHAESGERLTRLLRALAKWSELADRIAELAGESPDPAAVLTSLHERAIVLEYALDDPSSAVEALEELTTREPEDIPAALSRTRLALRASDWEASVERLGQLADLCPADAPWIELLRGEIMLHVLGREADAIDRLDAAASGLDGPLSQAARLQAIQATYLAGDATALDERLQREMLETAEDVREMWLPEVLETIRAARGAEAVAQMLHAGPTSTVARRFWQMMVSAASREPAEMARSLEELAEVSPDGAVSGACRAAAALLDPSRAPSAIDAQEIPSAEVLWHAADRMPIEEDPIRCAEICDKRADLVSEEDPLEWADWQLCRAEALAAAQEPRRALEVVNAALDRLPDHPGLLEAMVEISLQLEEHAAAVDGCKRLASYYDSDDQKATQLSRAATILFDHLGEDEEAESVVREALQAAPGHDLANEVLTRILSARGDDEALAQQIEDRIDAEYDTSALVTLYQEQADRLYAVDDLDGALEAIENLLLLAPDDHSAHRTKIDIMLSSQDWSGSYQAMREFVDVLDDPNERRSMIWRAAELRAQYLDEIDEALEMLAELIEQGDRHPQTFRYVSEIAKRGNRWEEAVGGLSRLADVLEGNRKLEVLREQAKLELENLFDPEAATATVEKALAAFPSALPMIKFASDFREPEDTQRSLGAAEEDLRRGLRASPTDPKLIADLDETAILLGETDVSAKCRAAMDVLAGASPSTGKTERAPTLPAEPARVLDLLVHPDERASAAAQVAALCAGMTKAVFGKGGAFPETGRSTLVGKRDEDLVRDWLRQWGALVGIESFEMHRTGADPRGSMPLPGEPPTVTVVPEMRNPYDAVERFFLARHLWRASQGLGAFVEGDAAGPVRWIMAVTIAALGDDARPPLPTDRDLVELARKAMPRKVRKALVEPCQRLVEETPKSIRAWLQATSFTADRLGLLAAGDLAAVIRPLIEESAGPAGVRRYNEKPAEALAKVPRGAELIGFLLSRELLDLERLVGLAVEEAP